MQVITTRSYDDRLKTIANVREAGLSVCSGGILGLGEVSIDLGNHEVTLLDYHCGESVRRTLQGH